MAEVRLTDEESAVLRVVLGAIAVKDRTGEIGVIHGLNRFVSAHRVLNKEQRRALASIIAKLSTTLNIYT